MLSKNLAKKIGVQSHQHIKIGGIRTGASVPLGVGEKSEGVR